MKKSSLSYYAFLKPKDSPGVYKKIKATVKAAQNIGITSNYYIYNNTLHGGVTFLRDLLNTDSDYIFIRFVDKISPALFFVLLKLRYSGKIIIIDIPTPRVIGLREISLSERSNLYKLYRKSLSVSLGSWFLSPSHKVIQYSDESAWFKIGIKSKIVKMGNGTIINNEVPIINSTWPDKELRFIGVAQLETWHGYDRFIKAMASDRISNLPYAVTFTIVGDGPALKNLKDLVKNLQLEKQVKFTGMLVDNDLDEVFQNKHIGVSSLASFRKGINEASCLKTREYMSRGLSILAVGKDPDFTEELNMRFTVPNDNSIEPIVNFIVSLEHSKLPSPQYIREYAYLNLSYENKLKKILDIEE